MAVTKKHKQKIVRFFGHFMTAVRRNGRIRIRELQKILGLQIWVSTVFRVLRQFLTSTCEVLRITKTRSFFYPRKHQDLVRRLVFDLKWWRRILTDMPRASFAYVLGRLPMNVNWLSSDASGTFGMAGVLHFGRVPKKHKGFAGLFWQIQWRSWATIAPKTVNNKEGSVHINVAEFLAALITCETFAGFCKGQMTALNLDNITAKAWLDSARCTRYPFDRCAQGSHLHMLKQQMKLRTKWVRSENNVLADRCSRKHYSHTRLGHDISGARLKRVRPKWQNVLRFL